MNAITSNIEKVMNESYKDYTLVTIGHHKNIRPHFQERYSFGGTVTPPECTIFDKVFKCGDTVVWFKSPPYTWGALAGREGYALVRDGEIIESVLTMYS